ncbi:MAG: lipocalin-like domain-containing protein, partial [Deltaproteobacteria bacterium]
LLGFSWYALHQRDLPLQNNSNLNVAEALGGGDVSGYARALEPRSFSFPKDHADHPEFRNEWWYFTGNLQNEVGRPFGFQVTLFRNSLVPELPEETGSPWRTNQLYMGHLALSDIQEERFYHAERFQRAALGLAGVEAQPLKIWLDDWEIKGVGNDPMKWQLFAETEEFEINLEVTPSKPLVLQGNQGLSQKGKEPGNASYYYSFTRMVASGEVTTPEGTFEVKGSSWLDREWSTSVLESNQIGWDWFALQLNDGTDLMYYQLRDKAGKPDEQSSGKLVNPNGESRNLNFQEVALKVVELWQSPNSGASYPAGWTLKLPSENLDLQLSPRMSDQELQTTVSYWEGSVRVKALRMDNPYKA